MRWTHILLALGIAAFLAAPRPAAAADDAASFIGKTGDEVLRLIHDQSLSPKDYKDKIRVVADKSFDVPRIARYVLGRYWQVASEAEQKDFTLAFEDYMVQVYASRFKQYGGATFKVLGQKPQGNGTLVTTQIDRPNGEPPAQVNWLVVKAGNDYKITDVMLEGVSQAVTYHDEFSTFIGQHGGKVAALTQSLREKASSG